LLADSVGSFERQFSHEPILKKDAAGSVGNILSESGHLLQARQNLVHSSNFGALIRFFELLDIRLFVGTARNSGPRSSEPHDGLHGDDAHVVAPIVDRIELSAKSAKT
jgi:hypothetical protein